MEERYIIAVQKLAETMGLAIDRTPSDSPVKDEITIVFTIPGTNVDGVATFDKAAVVEWVENGEPEAKRQICAGIQGAKKDIIEFIG